MDVLSLDRLCFPYCMTYFPFLFLFQVNLLIYTREALLGCVFTFWQHGAVRMRQKAINILLAFLFLRGVYLNLVFHLFSQGAKVLYRRENSLRHESESKNNATSSSTESK